MLDFAADGTFFVTALRMGTGEMLHINMEGLDDEVVYVLQIKGHETKGGAVVVDRERVHGTLILPRIMAMGLHEQLGQVLETKEGGESEPP
jgi:hypothetical protein